MLSKINIKKTFSLGSSITFRSAFKEFELRFSTPSINTILSLLLNEDLLKAYKGMCLIRNFEDRVHDEFAAGELPGFVHLYAGEEASAIGICMNLNDQDSIASTHRGHGHCIAKGCDVNSMMKELFGKKEGIESFNFGIKSSTLRTFAKSNKVKFNSYKFIDNYSYF